MIGDGADTAWPPADRDALLARWRALGRPEIPIDRAVTISSLEKALDSGRPAESFFYRTLPVIRRWLDEREGGGTEDGDWGEPFAPPLPDEREPVDEGPADAGPEPAAAPEPPEPETTDSPFPMPEHSAAPDEPEPEPPPGDPDPARDDKGEPETTDEADEPEASPEPEPPAREPEPPPEPEPDTKPEPVPDQSQQASLF